MNVISVRRWHSYIGLFSAPSVLFFALTGATQLFSLHEAHGHYTPPVLLEKLSSVHKDQEFVMGHHHEHPAGADAHPAADAGAGAGAKPPAADEDDETDVATLMLKSFFLIVALSLTLSAVLGIYMGLTQIRRKSLAWGLLIAGALIPVGLLVV
jgi:hypothetical protein